MTILIFIIILAILILVHELGHFIAAKKSGIRVDEFGIGFPPRLLSWKPKNSETTYSLNIVPFGGFVKIFGENPDQESISGEDTRRSFINKPRYIQAWVLAAGVIFNIIFAWILIVIGLMSGLPAMVDDSNQEYIRDQQLTVVQVLADSPAEKAGLRVGDKIIDLNGIRKERQAPLLADEVSQTIRESGNKEITLLYSRGDIETVHEVRIKAEKGLVENTQAIGIAMDEIGFVYFPFEKALIEGTKTTGNLLLAVTFGLIDFIGQAVTGQADFSQVSGPVGIVGLVGNASELGLIYLLSFTALISLHLAILNLIPFPALDGGRIFFVLIESIIRRPINPKVTNFLNSLGFIILITLMVIITYHDITKLF